MGDGGTERPCLGPLLVDVYPLVVQGHVGKVVDAFLSDLEPIAGRTGLVDTRSQGVGHGSSPIDLRLPERQGSHGRRLRPGKRDEPMFGGPPVRLPALPHGAADI